MSGEREATAAAAGLPQPPDAAGVNAGWQASAPPGGGLRGALARLLAWLLRPQLEAQHAWNARQVQLDNAVLQYLQERLAFTHAHYDALLATLGRRLDEADERHRLLEQELVRHVHELVERIDLVLVESGRGRLSTQGALQELRQRLEKAEQALRDRSG
ncbi:MAG TPA: hypothetical protein VMX54_17335 [Vicinamibacteria bacterium]|nr:hypothetical protein [Vicinamibacteria bacterium]